MQRLIFFYGAIPYNQAASLKNSFNYERMEEQEPERLRKIKDVSPRSSVEMLDAGEARPWPVRALTLLLLLQAVGLIVLGVISFSPLDLSQENNLFPIIQIFLTNLTRTIAFGTLGALAVVAALGFLGLWRTGWPTAILLQGLTLLVTLGLYLRNAPPYIFALMSYCILMVIYLHHPDVQNAFQTKKIQEEKMEDNL